MEEQKAAGVLVSTLEGWGDTGVWGRKGEGDKGWIPMQKINK